MSSGFKLITDSIASQEEANELMGKLFEVTRPESVYSPPVTQGDYTVITASEVTAGIGYGYGGGGGGSDKEMEQNSGFDGGLGLGGGGGGGTSARPVAVIEIGPHGVRVEPVVDATKISLAFFTALGSMALLFGKMRRGAK